VLVSVWVVLEVVEVEEEEEEDAGADAVAAAVVVAVEEGPRHIILLLPPFPIHTLTLTYGLRPDTFAFL
jgi:hypothetical protein